MEELTKVYEVLNWYVEDNCIVEVAEKCFSTKEVADSYINHLKTNNIDKAYYVEEHIVFTDNAPPMEKITRLYEVYAVYVEFDGDQTSETLKLFATKEAAERYIDHLEKIKIDSETYYGLVDYELYNDFT